MIDFHTHAFPETVAERAIPALEKAGNVQAYTDGTTAGLLASMDLAGIEKSVVCSIATRPEQFQPILDWSRQIRSNRLIPLPSVHPEDPLLASHIRTIKEQGFVGIKLHPYYQDFFLAEDRLTKLYETVIECDLLIVAHTGFDIAYPRVRRADPAQVTSLFQQFPDLKLVVTHLGGIFDLSGCPGGKPLIMEISFALDFLSKKQARDLITSHQPDYLLFGTDSPWAGQAASLKQQQELNLDKELFEKIIRKNAERLLD